jgi:hypothetical protein
MLGQTLGDFECFFTYIPQTPWHTTTPEFEWSGWTQSVVTDQTLRWEVCAQETCLNFW